MLDSGHHVKAVWTDGQMYGARVLQFNGSHYLVAWDDGAAPSWVPAGQVQIHPDGGTPFVIGQEVRAQWTDGAYYGARLTQFNGAQYLVAWDDGADPAWLSPHQIEPAGRFTPGQEVLAQWTDGAYYGARVVQFDGARYEVAWDDDDEPNLWLSPHQIQVLYTAGQPVLAPWSDGEMYGARVEQFNGTHYLVAWDDGAPGSWFLPNQIQARRE